MISFRKDRTMEHYKTTSCRILCFLIAAAIAFCMGFSNSSMGVRAEIPDRQTWTGEGEWAYNEAEGTLQIDGTHHETVLSYEKTQLEKSWRINAEIFIEEGSFQILFVNTKGDPVMAVRLDAKNGRVCAGVEQKKTAGWKSYAMSDEVSLFSSSEQVKLTTWHYENTEDIWIRLEQNGTCVLEFKAEGLTIRSMSMLKAVAVSTDTRALLNSFNVSTAVKEANAMEAILNNMTPEEDGFYLAIAKQAVEDVITNFWTGDSKTGKIRPTWAGFSENLSDWRGSTWETAMLVFEICDLWQITGDERYHELLVAEARFFRENFREYELERAGGLFMWANDDTGWNAMLMLCLYSATGDYWFVERVIGLLDQAYARWYDPKLGGMRYKDGADYMALCEVGITWSWLRLYEITGEQRFYDLAFDSYSRLHNRMGREDGLYFMEANAFWTIGSEEKIQEASSSSFLGGNMCMAALSVKFYRLTGDELYLNRAYKTTDGILKWYNKGGVLLNDRDAWCNATFAAFYVSEVLSLPGTEEMQALIKSTAVSIVTNDRTEDGYYGGSWQGPAEGGGSVWHQVGSVARQSMTTGNSVLMVTAAAMLEKGMTGYGR